MGLDKQDYIKEPVSLSEAYSAIHAWYKQNLNILAARSEEWDQRSASMSKGFVDALPQPEAATEVEMKMVMNEVICGAMEWAYHESDGKHKMAAYAQAALESLSGRDLTEAQVDELRNSPMWPYTRQCQREEQE